MVYKSIFVFQSILQLEKELAYLGSMCAASLMKKDLALPVGMDVYFWRSQIYFSESLPIINDYLWINYIFAT